MTLSLSRSRSRAPFRSSTLGRPPPARRGASAVAALVVAALGLFGMSACGGGAPAPSAGGFIAHFPDEGPGGGGLPPPVVPPPTFPLDVVWNPTAVSLGRTAFFGSFSSDLVAYGRTLFVTDADAVEGDGGRLLAFDVSGAAPVASGAFATTTIHAYDLVDSLGRPGDLSNPIGFGYYLNDVEIAGDRLGFVLANAGGSDSVPTCSNVVVVDPTLGTIRQTVDLANAVDPGPPYLDSSGAAIGAPTFVQSGAEGLAYVRTAPSKGLLFVAMSNFIVGAPSYGAVKYPGTVEVFDVDETAAAPVTPRPRPGLATETIVTAGFNAVAVTPLVSDTGRVRLLVTTAGATAFDASFALVPVTPASIEVFDVDSRQRLGRFDLGLAGLSASRPALGRDAVGHHLVAVGSSVRGEVYLVRTDGLFYDDVIAGEVEVLRGPNNGIPIDPSEAGGPGGNVAGLALSADGRTLVASGFGDLFAFPAPKPGRLYALSLPADVVSYPGFGASFVAGTTRLVTAPGATLGPVVISPGAIGAPEVYTSVSGTIDPGTSLGTGPAHLGTLVTHGVIR